MPDLCQGQRERFAVLGCGRFRFAGALQQTRQIEMRGVRRLDRQARLKIALRLAPQVFVCAQAPEHQQKHRVARVVAEPALGALQLLLDIGSQTFGIQRKQPGVPLCSERFLDDAMCLRTTAERGEGLRRGRGNARIALLLGRDPAPVFT